jgi:RNA polymerase sigma-70 factor (ECF subfamily)
MQEDANDVDSELVRAMARGDRSAIARLYDRHAPVMLALAQRIAGDLREAEDLLHDVLLEAWRSAASFDPARGTVRAWLLMRVRSRAIDRRRAVAVARTVPLEVHEAHAQVAAHASGEQDVADHARVRRALASLPPEQRAVLELAYFEGLSSSEIAARLGTPIGTVKSRVAGAMTKLRAVLADRAAREEAP